MKKPRNYYAYIERPAYPNAADKNYLKAKHLDILTGAVSGIGLFTAMLYLILL